MAVPRSRNPPSIVSRPPFAEPLRPRRSIRFPLKTIGPDSSEMTMRGEDTAISASVRLIGPRGRGSRRCRRCRTSTSAVPSTPSRGTTADSARSTAMPSTFRFSAGDPADTSIDPPERELAAGRLPDHVVQRDEALVHRDGGGARLLDLQAGRSRRWPNRETNAAGGTHRIQLRDRGLALPGELPPALAASSRPVSACRVSDSPVEPATVLTYAEYTPSAASMYPSVTATEAMRSCRLLVA